MYALPPTYRTTPAMIANAQRAIGISNAIGSAIQSRDVGAYNRAIQASVDLGRQQVDAFYRANPSVRAY
jgi:hypothetical protein